MKSVKYDVVIVGSGPNGLAAAVRLASAGLSVKVFEAEKTIGGGTRTKELIMPGFWHDVCSAIHPMAMASPYLRTLPLKDYGLEWIHPEIPCAHPLDNGGGVFLRRSIKETEEVLGSDARVYRSLMEPMVNYWNDFTSDILGPLGIPKHPVKLALFGLKALQPATLLAKRFKTPEGKALFGGIAAHSILDLDKITTSAIGLVLGAAGHAVGWPMPKGGSHMITESLAKYFVSLGGEIQTGVRVETLEQLPPSKVVMFNLTPRQVGKIVNNGLPESYLKKLQNYRYGAGVFKIDYILKEPVPWANPDCAKAGTVHVAGTFEDIVHSEKQMSSGVHAEKPYVLVTQQSLFDSTRTPDNRHTLWAYCHVPNGSKRDMTHEIEAQIERFAPGFRDVIEARVTMNCEQMESYNANYIGGDINGGMQDLTQLFSRPVSLYKPYNTPAKNIYFCSASTPPGGGVHGMGGYHAAEAVLNDHFKSRR